MKEEALKLASHITGLLTKYTKTCLLVRPVYNQLLKRNSLLICGGTGENTNLEARHFPYRRGLHGTA